MTKQEFIDELVEFIEEGMNLDTTTFEEACLLTQNDGLVVTLDNGKKFYLTVQD